MAMSCSLHLHDQPLTVLSKGLHEKHGGFVVLDSREGMVTIHSCDLPALATAFAEASKAVLELARQELNQKVRKAEPANGLDLAKLSELAGISD